MERGAAGSKYGLSAGRRTGFNTLDFGGSTGGLSLQTDFLPVAVRARDRDTREDGPGSGTGNEASAVCVSNARCVKGRGMSSSATRSSKANRRELLRIDGRPVEVTMRLNPRARRLIVKVHPSTGEVTVVAPSRRALDHALEFARGESEWIARRLAHVPKPVILDVGARIPFRGDDYVIGRGEGGRAPVWIDRPSRVIRVAGQREHVPRRILDFLKREARKELDARALDYGDRIGAKPKRIAVRDTASRWGSCSTTRALSFSWRLILAPTFVLDYVVAHEVAHLRQMNHGPRFWELVRDLVGDVEKPQAWLSRNGPLLHRYVPPVRS